MSLALINPKVWLELALVAVLVFCGWYAYNAIYDRGAASVQAKWEAEKLATAQASAKVTADALATTKALADAASKRDGETNAQISKLNTSLATAIAGLSNRPARPDSGSVPGAASDGKGQPGCTGAGLYKDDGQFLARYARDTAELQLRLKACYAQYDDLAAKLR